MATEKILGRDLTFSVDGVVVGCAQTVELSTEVSMIDAACRESGSFYDGVPDLFSAELSLDGLIMYDTPVDALAMRAWNIAELHMAKTRVEWEFGSVAVGHYTWAGEAYITNYTETGEQEGVATYSATFKVVGEYTHVVNA